MKSYHIIDVDDNSQREIIDWKSVCRIKIVKNPSDFKIKSHPYEYTIHFKNKTTVTYLTTESGKETIQNSYINYLIDRDLDTIDIDDNFADVLK